MNHFGIHDLQNALTYLVQQPGVDGGKLGAVGYCMGGGFALAWACKDKRLKVVAPYYAFNPRPLEAGGNVCPIVGSYPDPDFSTNEGKKLDIVLDQKNIPHDI